MRTRGFLVAMALLMSMAFSAFAGEAQLVGPGKLFVRFTNIRPDEATIVVRVHVGPNIDKPFGW